jgi:hypothetical protein
MSRNVLWWGGGSYGPRYMCELLLPLSLCLAVLWPRLVRVRLAVAALALTIAVGVGVQVVGAFLAPCGWAEQPRHIHYFPEERLWDWRDPEIARCLLGGLRQGPKPLEFLAAPPAQKP